MGRFLPSTVAVVIANIAALLLFALFASVDIALAGEEPWPDILLNTFFFVGLFGSFVVFTTVFPVSLMLAYLGLLLRWTHMRIYVGGGYLVCLAFTLFASVGSPIDIRNALFFMGIGPVCGWIYWRIAIGRTPSESHAIAER